MCIRDSLDVARGDQHEVGELVDHDEQIRVGLELALAALGQHDLSLIHI